MLQETVQKEQKLYQMRRGQIEYKHISKGEAQEQEITIT